MALRTASTGLLFFLALGWGLWACQARPDTLLGPAGDVAICLALALRSSIGWPLALAAWALVSLWSSVLSGGAWFWLLLGGWPAWILSHTPKGKSITAHLSYLVSSAGLISLTRFLLKLGSARLLSSQGLLTVSGVGLLPSLWAEFLCNLTLLAVFSFLASLVGGKNE